MSQGTPLFNLVKETSTTTGTGTLTLAGAVAGFAGFSVVGTGKRCTICIRAVNGSGVPTGAYEVCRSIYTLSGTTLTRGTLLASSTNSRITFASGTKEVTLIADASVLQPKFWDLVNDFDADPTGIADSTAALQLAYDTSAAAGGGVIWADGTFLLSASPTTVNGSTAQIHIPDKGLTTDAGVGIMLKGPWFPSPTFSVVGSVVLPTTGTIFHSTATSDAVFGGKSANGTYAWTMVQAGFENIVFRTQDNPACTALDLSYIAGHNIKNCIVDTGVWDIDNCTLPSTSTAYGVKMPLNNNGAWSRIDGLLIVGYYTGILLGEHADIAGLSVASCKYAGEISNNNHALYISRWLDTHCQNGIRCTASSTPHPRLDVAQYAIEQVTAAHQGTAKTWQIRAVDVIDGSNLLYGQLRYAVVEANVGPQGSGYFTKTSATNFTCTSVGS